MYRIGSLGVQNTSDENAVTPHYLPASASRSASIKLLQDVVDAGEVALAFGAEPVEHLRVEADAHRGRPNASGLASSIISLWRS